MQFWSATKDHNNYVPSTDLVKAITQCLNYIYAIEREANSVKFIEKTKSKVIKPRCILIFGRSNDWNDEQREAYRILNAAYNQISILTYDHLLFRAKNVLGITEDIDTTDDDELPFNNKRPSAARFRSRTRRDFMHRLNPHLQFLSHYYKYYSFSAPKISYRCFKLFSSSVSCNNPANDKTPY